jgi:hypothetical protein
VTIAAGITAVLLVGVGKPETEKQTIKQHLSAVI